MDSAPPPTAVPAGSSPAARMRVARSDRDRIVSGVAAGIAARLGVAPDLVRAALVTLSFAGGVGILIYGIAWVVSRPADDAPARRPVGARQLLGLGLMLLGVLLLLRAAGIWFGDELVWPAGLVSFGIAAMWSRRPSDRRDLLGRIGDEAGRPTLLRFAAGAFLIVGGAALFIGSVDAFSAFGPVVLATAIAGIGVALVFGPWILRLAGDLARERRERIRSEERAEMAAHLHDSVLQTLSLIQRSDDSRQVKMLARAQERELRSWLFGGRGRETDRLGAALRAAADRVEADLRVAVEVIAAGDDPQVDDAVAALVAAAGEAMTNAAKHSGADKVSVYAEAEGRSVDVWIADHGRGFDPAAVPADRRGVTESIVARMRRAGGSAAIISTRGEGTEVHLSIGGKS